MYGDQGADKALIPTALQTSAYTAQPQDLVLVNATAGTVAVTLPAAPPDRTRVGVYLAATASGHQATIAGNGATFNDDATTSMSLVLADQGVVLQYNQALTAWYMTSAPMSLAQLDARYAGAGSGMTNPMTTAGDLITGGTSGAPQRLAHGSAGQALITGASGAPAWASAPVDWLNVVTGYGAVPAVQRADGAMTASSSTLTSASGTFTSGDAGKAIFVLGAGSGGATLAATIASVATSTSVTLSSPAVTTVGGATYAYGADSTAALTSAIAALPAGGGVIYVPAGAYICNTAAFNPVSGLHLAGDGYMASTIYCNAGGSYFMNFDGTGGLVEDVRVSGLTINATGMDIFTGANMERCQIVSNRLIQNSPGNAIFKVSGGTTLMQECLFGSNEEYVYGNPRTIEAWHLDFSGTGQACNDNTWDYTGRKIFSSNSSPGDTAMYWMKLIGASSGNSGSRGNKLRNMVFELRYGTGGLVHMQNVAIADLINITSEDLGSGTAGNPLLLFDGLGAGDGCTGILIRSYSRRGGSLISNSVPDIKLNANCAQFTIESPRESSGGANLNIDLQSAVNVRQVGAWPNSYTLQNSSGLAPAAAAGFASLNPAGTTSTSLVMMGLGSTVTYTPHGSGNVLVNVSGLVSVATAAVVATVEARYGNGTAPANGVGTVGTVIGSGPVGILPAGTSGGTPFAFTAVLHLTPGTTYWLDLAMKTASASDQVTATLVAFTLMETS